MAEDTKKITTNLTQTVIIALLSTTLLSACSNLSNPPTPSKTFTNTPTPTIISFPKNQINVNGNYQTFTNTICQYSLTIPKSWVFEKQYINNNSNDCEYASGLIFSNKPLTDSTRPTNLVKVDFYKMDPGFNPTILKNNKYSFVYNRNGLKVYRIITQELVWSDKVPILKYIINVNNQFYGATGYFDSYKYTQSLDKIFSTFQFVK